MLDAELLTLGLKFHGHKCPAMPMGLRAGVAAMRALGPVVEYPFPVRKGIFEAEPCAKCGEIVFADKLRVQGDALVCIPCSGYER